MTVFYALDLGVHGPEDWEECKMQIEARSPEHAAEVLAGRIDKPAAAGLLFELAVSLRSDGSGAQRVCVRCHVQVSYHAESSEPCEIGVAP